MQGFAIDKHRCWSAFSVWCLFCGTASSFSPRHRHRITSIASRQRLTRSLLPALYESTSGVESGDEFMHDKMKSSGGVVRRAGSSVRSDTARELSLLRQENEILKKTVQQLQLENEALTSSNHETKIVIETFEGEDSNTNAWYSSATGTSKKDEEATTVDIEDSCNENNEEECPVEPGISFWDALRDRAYWLVGLLAFQSCSGFILSHNEALLQNHPVIIYFLTMLVGAGGNAGNQASVRVIRGLALGTLNDGTQQQFLQREFKMALSLSAVLSCAGFIRAIAFQTPLAETVAVTCALALIVFSSICLGAILPLILKKLRIDPAHSSTTIQVVMDILGVVFTVIVSAAVLDSPLGQFITARLMK